MSESTWLHARELACLELDLVQVVGKTHAVRIYGLLGDELLAAEPWFVDLKSCHDDALAAYRRRDWATAEHRFSRCRHEANGLLDQLYDMYLSRLAEFRNAPPDEDWDFVYRPTRK